jgi:Domain of unknown function (DUF6883)
MTDAETLLNANRAVIPREKLEDYLLNLDHEIGRHKARVFGAALGIHREDWEYLRERIIEGIVAAPVSNVRDTDWGRCYEVALPVEGLNGRTRVVLTVWFIASAGDPPRFVTGYLVDPSGDA